MSSPEQEFQTSLSANEFIIQNRLDLQVEIATCSQDIADAHERYQALLGRLMASEVEIAARGIDKAFLYATERGMPPILTLVEDLSSSPEQ